MSHPADKEKIEDILAALSREIVRLDREWKVFLALFGHSRKRFELLKAVAPAVFGPIQEAMKYSVLMQISRLLDPAQSQAQGMKKDNLSFLGVLAALRASSTST